MKKNQFRNLPLDEFINLSLYDKKFGYYMKTNPFGKGGDFITAPNISRLFSEMIAIWILGFWQSIGSPKKFNLIELGAGNGEMMKVLIESFKNFPNLLNSCNIIIHEKSPNLIKIQKKKLVGNKIIWISEIKKIKQDPCIFIANEFFDSIAIKQFLKKKKIWFERFVSFQKQKKSFFYTDKEFNMKKFEKKINYKISKNRSFIEYSNLGIKYLKEISKKIKDHNGGLLIIDYGYFKTKMENTLQAVRNHKFADVLENFGNTDITHNINFNFFKDITKKLFNLEVNLTTQKKFLIKMGIKKRAEIISKDQSFLKKADVYYRLQRLIDDRQMGNLFKFMLIKKKENKFKLGF